MSNQRELSDPVTLRLPRDLLAEIEAIAEITERSRSWVMVRAMKAYMASEGRDILHAAEGQRQIAEGDSYDLNDVLDELDSEARSNAA
ncbi:CopG family ribbon-helix-helix protein [Mesorhizobium sp. IMUNJ 23232]|uniref:CopG family ribbon-helix-helix protein n=1 Tax=Mesorhizobium sp. IMUNJ 23232 TaxID=3376064 RepID=UPI0037AA89D6